MCAVLLLANASSNVSFVKAFRLYKPHKALMIMIRCLPTERERERERGERERERRKRERGERERERENILVDR